MAYPFDVTEYDTIYTSISSELKIKYPQHPSEDIITWYRRLLFEYITYLQTKYESTTQTETVETDKKTNKKKDNPGQTKFTPTNTALFDEATERALDVVSYDSNFAIYLFIEWLPLLLVPGDYINVTINIDQSDTPARGVQFRGIEFEYKIDKVTIKSVNNMNLSRLTPGYFSVYDLDPFLKSIFKIISYYSRGTTVYDYEDINEVAEVNLSPTNYIINSFKIGEILYKIKEITKALYIEELTLESNLIVDNGGVLSVKKDKTDKINRKKFNSRKYIKGTSPTQADVCSNILQTLLIAIFRTYYDFDPATISETLFNYLFKGGPLFAT